MKKRYFLVFLGTIVLSLILGLGQLRARSTNTILVSAAASLKDALEEIDPRFKKAEPSVRVNYNFGASGALQQQIEQGAPADLFISAARKQMDALENKGLIVNDSRKNLLTNRLVLIVPKNSTLNLGDFRSLTDSKVQKIAVGEPKSVPVGQYTEEVFNKLGIMNQVKPKLVLGNSVRNVLAAVESGNADAGVVYLTDAKISDKVKVVATAAANLHSPIVYPMAIVKATKDENSARAYAKYLTGSSARTVFEKFGFGVER